MWCNEIRAPGASCRIDDLYDDPDFPTTQVYDLDESKVKGTPRTEQR